MLIVLCYLTLCIVWGTTYLALKISLEGFEPYFMAGIRFLIAGMLMLPYLIRKREKILANRKEWLAIALSAVCMLVGANGFVTWSEVYLNSGITALTVSTNPAWAALLGGLFFARDERYGKLAMLGVVLSMVGVYVLHHDRISFSNAELPGVIMACLAPIFWSLGSLIARKYIKQTDSLSATVIQMLVAGILFFPLSLAVGETWQVHLTSRVIFAMLFLILIGSTIVYGAYVYLLKRIPASRVTTYTYINPIVALLLGNLILHEPISPEIIPATLLILGGLALVYFSRPRKSSALVAETAVALEEAN